MKNIFFNLNTIIRRDFFLFVFFLLSQINYAQCDTGHFTVSKTNSTCFSNGSITVDVPTATSTNCSTWVAVIDRVSDGYSTQLAIPNPGGTVAFTSLPPGSYNVSLTNGFQTIPYPSNPIVITSTYVNMSVSVSSTTPSCQKTATGYVANGTLTATVANGTGIGPFVYSITASNGVQTVTSPTRTHTFSGVPGGETVTVSVTDQVGGSPGCSTTSTQSHLSATNTAAVIAYSDRPFNYERGACTPVGSVKKSYVNLTVNTKNLTTASLAIVQQTGNATLTIGGNTYNLSYIGVNSGNYRFKYDPITTGGPNLVDGNVITTTFFDGCNSISKTSTVVMNDDYLVPSPSTITDPTTCTQSYRIILFGQSDVSGGSGYTDRAIYFSAPNTVLFERRNASNVWEVVPGSEITPNPYTNSNSNPMGVITGIPIPSASAAYFVSQPGDYRITASDNCHTVQSTVTVSPINPFTNIAATQTTSVLEGTSSIKIHFNGQPPLTSPIKIKVTRVDRQTSMTINPTQPANLAGTYTINFPIERTLANYPVNYYYIQDLPLGKYNIELTDGCSDKTFYSKNFTVDLTNPVSYSALFSVTPGCIGSNSIAYNMNPVNTPNSNSTVQLYTDNGSGGAGILVKNATSDSLSGNFTNLNSGNYIIQFSNIKAEPIGGLPYYSAAMNNMGPWQYRVPIKIDAYDVIKVATVTSFCDIGNTNSGIILAQVTSGTIGYPITFSLYSVSNPSTPLIGQSGTFNSPIDAVAFQDVPVGEYFVRVTTPCYSVDSNVSLSTTGVVPKPQVSNPVICPGSPTTVAIIAASQNLFDVDWYANGVKVGTGMPITLSPTVTTTYTAKYRIKSVYGCTNSPEYESDVTVTVTPDPDVTLAVSDIDLCLNTNRDFTISNSQPGFIYELTNSLGVSYTPPVKTTSTGGNLVMTIPTTISVTPGNIFKIKVSNGNVGCSGYLSDTVSVISRNVTQNLIVNGSTVCSNTDASITIQSSENSVTYQIYKNGLVLSPAVIKTGTGSDITFPISASQLNSGTNTFTINASASGCTSAALTQSAIVLVDQAPSITKTLDPIVLNGCDNIAAPVAKTTIAELEAMGLIISDDFTSNSNLIVSSTDSAITGTLIKSFTRTYTIKDSCNNAITVNQVITLNITTPTKPTITAGSSTTFCAGDSVVLTSSATTGNQWFKDGVVITGEINQTFTATTGATYTVVTTNSLGCSSIASAGIGVTVNTLPVATINNGITLAYVNCTATSIDLTASNGSGFEWYYSPDNVTAFSVLPAVTQTITAANLGFYKVKVINSTNCEALSQVTHVVATPAVSATELETCVGNTITLESDATSFVNPTYQWKKGGINISNATTQNWNVTEDGEYTVTVTDGRLVGNIGTETSCGVNVTFNPLPTVNAGADFTISCTNNIGGLIIGETPESGFDYAWTSSNGTSGLSNAAIANPIANPTVTTTYTVTKTNQTTLCWQEDSITITVDTAAPVANAGIDFTKTCIANTLGKEIGVTPISGITYSWLPITGLDDATKANPIANPVATTIYTLTATNIINGCFSTDTVVTTVDVSTPIANAGTDFTKTCATNPSGRVIGTTAVTGVSYLWSPSTDLSDATISNPNANPLSTTTYTLTATKIATGCTATDSVIVTVSNTPNPVALSTTIANNCPLETVDLTTIQPAAVSGIVYEWWTGTATTRVTQITNPTLYATAGTIYLWSKSVSEGCYNAVPSAVNVSMNVCCESTIGVIQETNPFYLVNYAPADITTLEHINYATSSVVRYAIVNDLDGKIKQINTTKPEFTQLPAGNYTVHAFVFGPTVVPTGLVVGNKLAQVVPFCGTTATKTLRVQSICSSAMSYTETLTNAKQYALLDTTTDKFVQVNTTGKFTMIHTGMPHQVIGFNYTGTATGIQVGGTIAGVTATNLDITAGAIISGCTAIITQIDGNIYNDKDKRCIEGLNNQTGLPLVTLYAKLLDSTNQVIAVSSTIQSPNYTFSMAPDLLDGVYSIVLDDNDSVTDAVATYPNSWKGNTQTFTIASGQIVEYLSNTANFVPMCMQAATNKPILKPTANLVGNTYNFCKGVAATSLIIDALPGATVNWYTTAVGGVAKSTPFIPTTSVVGTTTCYVSQTLNGAESDRTEVIIDVHDLPEQPTAISGSNFIAANTTQLYGVVNSTNAVTYNWILPTDWTGTSTSKDITVQVGTKDGTIGVTATSAFGCISPIQELVVRVVLEDDIEVYNSLSPNGDGDNDIFRIRNIDFYPENTLSIFNRWGIEVYHVNSYGQNDNFFKGFSDGRSTTSRDVELPEGTYFYTLTYKNTKGIERNLSGYLYIKQ